MAKQFTATNLRRLIVAAIFFAPIGCTSPLWWHDANRGFIYRGWSVNIVDQASVMRECAAVNKVLGCVNPKTMTAFTINNSYVLAHECHHIDAIMAGQGDSREKVKDVLLTLFGVNDLLTAATIIFPAPNNCGDGTMAEWRGGRMKIIQARYGKSQILPSLEEWNRTHPEREMRDSAQLDEIRVPPKPTDGGFTGEFVSSK